MPSFVSMMDETDNDMKMVDSAGADSNYTSMYNNLPQLPDSSIRLLSLQPGRPTDEVNCTLSNNSVESDYEALSYTWRLKTDQNIFSINRKRGRMPNNVVPVPSVLEDSQALVVNGLQLLVMQNLADALISLRFPDRARTLWVDFLCINQEDDHDRTTQVGRMGTIYSQARQVVVWLGLDDSDCADAMIELSLFHQKMHFTDMYPGLTSEEISRKLEPVLAFIARPWFSRIWTVQEVVLARQVVVRVGNDEISWDALQSASQAWTTHRLCCSKTLSSTRIGNSERHISMLSFAVPTSNDRWQESLGEAMFHFHHRAASDPRDRVFAVLGLIAGTIGVTPSIRPDYGLSTAEVYAQATFKIMKDEKGLSILAISGNFIDNASQPTWVSNFQYQRMSVRSYHRSKASFNMLADVRQCSVDGLRTSAAFFDRPKRVSRLRVGEHRDSLSQESLQDTLLATNEWDSIVRSLGASQTPYAIDNESAFRKTLEHEASSPWGPRDYNNWRQWLEASAAKPSASSIRLSESEQVRKYQLTLARDMKTFFITEAGRFGMAFPGIDGDASRHRVVILPGGQMPFILRDSDVTCDICGHGRFKVVCAAYVHGAMDGEIVREAGPGTGGNEQDDSSSGIDMQRHSGFKQICLI